MAVGLVIVSHSAALASGVAELAAQMAPDVTIEAAGGGEDGSLGTDFDKISSALGAADSGAGVVVLYDLGSALLTTETALEFLDPDDAARIVVVDAPLVEGALAAAVAAQGGDDRELVAAAARTALSTSSTDSVHITSEKPEETAEVASTAESATMAEVATTAEVELTNPLGLHARPAAQISAAASRWDAAVSLGRPDSVLTPVRQVLAVVALALRGGETVHLAATGPESDGALKAITSLIADGFGEKADGFGEKTAGLGEKTAGLGEKTAPIPASSQAVSGIRTAATTDSLLHATSGSPGLAIGAAHVLDALEPDFAGGTVGSPDTEATRLTDAVSTAQHKLSAGSPFDVAHAAMVADPALLETALAAIQLGAGPAWWQAVSTFSRSFADSGDETVAARAVDIREAGAAVLRELGIDLHRIPGNLVDKIVVAIDLGPSEIPQLIKAGAVGALLADSSSTAHAVIVGRGLGLPMVIRAGLATSTISDGQTLILNGDSGIVNLHPTPEEQLNTEAHIADQRREAAELKAEAGRKVLLANGNQIKVCANIGSVADAVSAVENGADGIGLLRTELLVLDRPEFPDEDAQFQDLLAIFQILGEREIVVRVLDAGGDKPVAALQLDPTINGFLGVRGLRWLLANPEILHTQLRAICRAALGHHVHLMAPMVTYAGEVTAFREAVQRAILSLSQEQIPFAEPEAIGVMIEVPAAALAADEICAVADFVSIGSNDLTSYTMAADRTVPGVADLLNPGATAITRLLEQICGYASRANTPVALCGEMAAVPAYATELVRLGVTELSMAPSRIPSIKHHLRETPTDPVATLIP